MKQEGENIVNTTCPKLTAYTYHKEREERYAIELAEIKEIGGRNMNERAKQALQNACSSEFIDATVKLRGHRIRIAQKDRIFSTEHRVIDIVKVTDVRSDERACFGIVHKDAANEQAEMIPIFPSTKIFILKEEAEEGKESCALTYY